LRIRNDLRWWDKWEWICEICNYICVSFSFALIGSTCLLYKEFLKTETHDSKYNRCFNWILISLLGRNYLLSYKKWKYIIDTHKFYNYNICDSTALIFLPFPDLQCTPDCNNIWYKNHIANFSSLGLNLVRKKWRMNGTAGKHCSEVLFSKVTVQFFIFKSQNRLVKHNKQPRRKIEWSYLTWWFRSQIN